MSTHPSHDQAIYSQRSLQQDPVRMSSLRGYWSAFFRHFWFASFCTLPVIILVVYFLGKWPKEYTSTAMMLYDSGVARTETRESSTIPATRVAAIYSARFQDPDFIERLALKVEEMGFPKPEAGDGKLKKTFGKFLPEGFQPSSWTLSPDDYVKRQRVEAMIRMLKPDSVPAQNQLSMTATADNPDYAQLLARESVNFFIVEELSKQREKLLAQSKQLSTMESSLLREKAAPGDVAKTETVRTGDASGNRAERRQMKTEEQTLITAYLAKQAEFTRAQTNQVERELQLESDLNNLLSRKGIDHPDVIQKRREIEKFSREGVKKIEDEMLAMRQRLNEVQLELKRRGIAIDRSVQISGFPDEMRRYLMEVSNQIRTLELEAENLEEQINNPARRTRYLMVREPERPSEPSNRKQFLAAAGVGMALVLISFFLVIIVREMANPFVSDQDSLQMRYGLPVAAQVQPGWLAKTPLMNVEQVRELRTRLGSITKKKIPELMLLDSYRYLQQLLGSSPNSQVVLVLDLAEERSHFSLAMNMANVMATDSAERVILLSFQNRGQNLVSGEAADLMSFLGGSVDWKDCRIKANETVACDVALAHNAEQNLDVYREDVVRQLLTALREKYQRIIIDGFLASYLYENGILWRLADAVILQVGLNHTKKLELDRLLQLEDEAKVRAVVLQA